MRSIILAFVMLPLGWAAPAFAQGTPPDAKPSTADMLPLFAKNNCASLKDTADQLFCGDPDLNALTPKLSAAAEARLSRLLDRRAAIAENVEWITSRSSSCGVFGLQPVQPAAFPSVKACLLKATQDRIAILLDANFDCLAANTTASLVICADPELAIADRDLTAQMVTLIRKLREDEAKGALAEHARWVRTRDRICELDDKDNVPLAELETAEPCLNDLIKQKLAEVADAKGDPKKLFGKDMLSPSPDADAVDLCVGRIQSANSCENFLRISRVLQLDVEASERDAIVTAAVEMKVLAPFSICSPIAASCTGTCWDLQTRQAKAMAAGSRENISVGYRLTIEKSFAFQKAKDGSWRCSTETLRPVEYGTAQRGP
ncbi:MAG TPA: lysozyme inhibitor LprI family protein [Bradyrhizobium sp.]|nr:lysozyme inhibitor LprI family protein [Bradyrhizobium sp.]